MIPVTASPRKSPISRPPAASNLSPPSPKTSIPGRGAKRFDEGAGVEIARGFAARHHHAHGVQRDDVAAIVGRWSRVDRDRFCAAVAGVGVDGGSASPPMRVPPLRKSAASRST